MDLFSRFKTYYIHYFLGIIIPALVNGISIPLLKYWIGAVAYGEYALYFNGLLISNVLISGWLAQSVVRFTSRTDNVQLFGAQIVVLATKLPALLAIPVLLTVWYVQGSFLMGVLFASTLFLASVQLPLQSLTQAKFLSKITLWAEAIRTGTWLTVASILLWLHISFLPALFIALLLSYLFSASFLLYKNQLKLSTRLFTQTDTTSLSKTLLAYGLPLSVWFAFTYIVTYTDKLAMLHFFGQEIQGNYSAIFDFLSRGLVLLLAPVLSSSGPLLMEAFEKGETKHIQKLLQKLIMYELLILTIALIGFYMVGFKWLTILLHVPVTSTFLHTGGIIILATLIWQIALLVQKPLELNLQTGQILIRVALAFVCQLAFYLLMPSNYSPVLIPAGYLLAAVVYVLSMLLPVPPGKFSLANQAKKYLMQVNDQR